MKDEDRAKRDLNLLECEFIGTDECLKCEESCPYEGAGSEDRK